MDPRPLREAGGDTRATLTGSEDLGVRSARAGLVAVSGEGMKAAIGLGSTLVLARLLTPRDFGFVAMVVPVLAFVELAKGLGLPTATVQRSAIGPAETSTMFWASTAVGVGLAAVVALCAPLVGMFYGDARVGNIALTLAVIPVLHGAAAQHHALLERQMRFGRLAAADMTASVIGAGAAIITAVGGAEYWALVLGMVATAGANLILVWILCDWRPGRPGRSSAFREMLRFGRGLTGFRIVNFFARNADDILIGRFLGAAQLGLYSKAYALLMLPIGLVRTPLTRVAIPVLSRLQHDPQRFRKYLVTALTVAVSLSVPVVAVCLVAADDLVRVLLGDRWLEAVPVFRILAFAAFIQSFNVVTGWVYTALGQTDRWFRWGAFSSGIMVVAFVIGLPWGIEGVATAYAIAVAAVLYPSLRHCFRRAPIEVRDVLGAVWRPFAAGAGGTLAAWAARSGVTDSDSAVVRLAVVAVMFGIVYLAIWSVLPGGREYLRVIVARFSPTRPKVEGATP